MKTCNQGILKLCFEVDQKRSKYVWKIFETRSNFRFTHWHWPQFVGDCATKLGRPDLSKHGDTWFAWLILIDVALGRSMAVQYKPTLSYPVRWCPFERCRLSLDGRLSIDIHRSKDHECIRNCTVNGVYRIWRTRFFQDSPVPTI